MGSFVPGIHLVEQLVALMNNAHWTFYSGCQMGACHNDRNFKQTLLFRVKARHFAIDPNQVVV